MKRFGQKAAIVAVTAVFGFGILGTAAFAAFAPAPADSFSLVPTLSGTAEAPKGGDHFKALLDGLVSKGVITQAQEDAILAAVQNARGDKGHGDALRGVL